MNKLKISEFNLWRVMAVLATGFVIIISTTIYSPFAVAADQLPIPVESAQSSADHEKLAAYFDQQADVARERLKQHEELYGSYKEAQKSLRTLPIGRSRDAILSIVRHCELLVENARRDVESYEAIAQQHREHARLLKE